MEAAPPHDGLASYQHMEPSTKSRRHHDWLETRGQSSTRARDRARPAEEGSHTNLDCPMRMLAHHNNGDKYPLGSRQSAVTGHVHLVVSRDTTWTTANIYHQTNRPNRDSLAERRCNIVTSALGRNADRDVLHHVFRVSVPKHLYDVRARPCQPNIQVLTRRMLAS